MKKFLAMILILTLTAFLTACGNEKEVSSAPVESVSTGEVSSEAEPVNGEWWNTERLGDWGLGELKKPDSKGASYIEYAENERIKLVIECKSLDYATEYAKYVFDFISEKYGTVYKGAAGKRDGKAGSFEATSVMDFSTYKLYSMLYDCNGANLWITVTGDLNDDKSAGMIFFVSKALG